MNRQGAVSGARAGSGLRIAARILVPLGLVLALGGVGYFFTTYQGVTVMGESMRPTYSPGERLVAEDVAADGIRRGDVVLVHVPDRYRSAPVLQRVIGTGGDHVTSDGDRITVNGEPVDEPYVMPGDLAPATDPYDVRVPEGRLFLLGDNRGNAHDSRFFLDDRSGSVATSAVLGRVRDGAGLPVASAVLGVLGIVLTLVGTGLGIGGYAAGRSPRRLTV
ncbi:signal peptidase I [Streptomyces sp. NPDC018338]|uniref:signal peptidase I n=1 Tax=Streptomyces sp. NPDC018338 TaxID=3157192 RepID=UPI0033CEC5CF